MSKKEGCEAIVMTSPKAADTATLDLDRQRAAVLRSAQWFPFPSNCLIAFRQDPSIALLAAELNECLGREGIAACRLTKPLTCEDFISLAAHFGPPEPERDSTLAHRVQDGVVLNLKPDTREGITELTQPFSDSPLTFHVEGSRRPLGTAPAYLLFQCISAPTKHHGGQTILRSIADAMALLPTETTEILADTIMYPDSTTATVVGSTSGRAFLNFRDPYPDPVHWRSNRSDTSVKAALQQLLAAIYRSDRVCGVPWVDHLVVVVDNRRWLHGRTAGGTANRHLQRVRVQADTAAGVPQ